MNRSSDARYRILESRRSSEGSDGDVSDVYSSKARICRRPRRAYPALAMVMLGLRQFFLLLWKGVVLRRRHYVVTLMEVVIPLAVIGLYVWLRTHLDQEAGRNINPPVHFRAFDPLGNDNNYYRPSETFLYTPDSDHAKALTEAAVAKIPIGSSTGDAMVIGVSSEKLMEGRAQDLLSNHSFHGEIYGLVFRDLGGDSGANRLRYKIRSTMDMRTTQKFPAFSLGGPSMSDYIFRNFLRVQCAVESAFIESRVGKRIQNLDLKVQRFPFPSYYDLSALQVYISLISMVITFSFSISMIVFVKRIVDERVNRAKEMMRMMGLNDFVYWAGTFTNTYLLIVVILSLTTILFVIPITESGKGVIMYSDSFLLWVIFILYAADALLFCMTLSTLFNKSSVSTIATCIAWSVTYSVPRFLLDPPGEDHYDRLSLGTKLAVALFPNMGFHWALRTTAFYEGIGEGSNWSNFDKPPPGDNLSLAMTMAMMLFSCFMYSFLTFYLDNVWPWQFGIPKHPLFIFKPSYWCPKRTKTLTEDLLEARDRSRPYFEEEPKDKKIGISISGLTKAFGWGSSRKVAVKDVTLNIYHGEITALLGHNGAGKTTTMNVITGLFPPTSGTAIVNGYNILENLKMARRSLGLCPQHNVLYENLTVEEHLAFFAGLKGRSFSEMKPEITSCLELLQLQNKRGDLSRTLSGGMKRKLCLGIAMIGGSEVLILDEPTSGMDPQARRAIWDLLHQIKENRTIVLTTHYMEEADILGDRIAIMAEGVVQCCGSPLFLKRKFGAGYHLRVSKGELFKEHKLREVVQNSVPSAYVDSEMRSEVGYVLPVTDSLPFADMFQALEAEKENIGFTACGLTITTMEDVFLRVGHLADRAQEVRDSDTETVDVETVSSAATFKVRPEDRLTGLSLWAQQVRGLVLKRFHDSRRYWLFLVFLILLPSLVLVLMLYTRNAVNSTQTGDIEPLEVNLEQVFGFTEAFIGGEPGTASMLQHLKEVMEGAGAQTTLENNVQEKVLSIAEKNLQRYKRHILVGGIVYGSRLTAMYNGEAYHTATMALNLMNVALLRNVTDDPRANIELTNAPFHLSRLSVVDVAEFMSITNRLIFAFFMPLALSFLSASFVLFAIHERQTKSKLIQLMTGVDGLTFWFTHFLWDFAMHFVASCFMLIPFVAMDKQNVYTSKTEATGALFLMLLMYGWASIPLSYLLSFISKKPSTGFTAVTAINFISGTLATGGITIYKLVARKDTSGPEKFAWAFRFFPNFAMTWGTANLDVAGSNNVFCDNLDQELMNFVCLPNAPMSSYMVCCPVCNFDVCFKKKDLFSFGEEGCGRDLLCLTLTGILFFVVLALCESNLVRFWYRFRDSQRNRNFSFFTSDVNKPVRVVDEADVSAERTRVELLLDQGLRQSEEALVVQDLTKYFGNINAVDHVTFAVHQEECFGLLGVNGAGKTTTFSMLTGDLTIGEGSAMIGNYSVREDLKMFQRQVGYCPQFDALLDRLTGRETLYLFARLRGVPEKEIPRVVSSLINVVDLQKHADKATEKYSGGNRRKLSLAVSLVGSPPMVFLDEPTAGVDPASRRKIWNTFVQVQQSGGTSFILTTHSMEECEALCGRLVIMVNGQFRCLGPIQYLKQKFGQGYTIIVKLNKEQHLDPQATQAVKQFFTDVFPGSCLKDVHQGMLHYHIEEKTYTWSHLFREMEKAKQTFNLEDYLISDTTLEQIFLAFAKTQRIVAET